MKPEYDSEQEYYGHIYKCTSCGATEIWDNNEFCPMCGVKIDWEGVTWDEEVIVRDTTEKVVIIKHLARD